MPVTIDTNSPGILTYVKLEPRTKKQEFDVTLQGSVHDGLWMLTQQYRSGEFNGEDAASPIFAAMNIKKYPINKFKVASPDVANPTVVPYNTSKPLEPLVEKLPFYIDLSIRVEMGIHWLKLLKQFVYIPFPSVSNVDNAFITTYEISANPTQAEALINADEMALRKSSKGRIPDGFALYTAFKGTTQANVVAGISSPANVVSALNSAQQAFCSWYEQVYYQPSVNDASSWSKHDLEYKFNCSAPSTLWSQSNEHILESLDYAGGKLDWYNFIRRNQGTLGSTTLDRTVSEETITFIPVPLHFKGMPVERWWQFEDKNIDYGALKDTYSPNSTTNLPLLSILNFGLNYSNDWFIIPYRMESGNMYEITGFSVKNVIDPIPHIVDSDDDLRWSMYNINQKNVAEAPDRKIFIPPVIYKSLESNPIEKIVFLRDEMANLVWGVEELIPDNLGGSLDGRLAQFALQDYKYNQYSPAPTPGIAGTADISYHVMNQVPENWIPFIPQSRGPGSRSIVFTRSTLYRIIKDRIGNPPELVRPRTPILSEGLPSSGFWINEEEILRSGIVLTTSFQRTRWHNGKIITWMGRKKMNGRGEGNSGLKFDYIT